MAPTARPSPSPFPSRVPPAPLTELERAYAAQRAAALRRHTAQCDHVVSDQLADAAPRLSFCDDFPRAVEMGSRSYRDGPFALSGCSAVWFSPSEACELLRAHDLRVQIVGDSLTRQLQQGIFMALTGQFTWGGVPKLHPDEMKRCVCEEGFSHPCREATYSSFTGRGTLVCPTWIHSTYVATGFVLSSVPYFEEHMSEVKGSLYVASQHHKGAVLVLGLGLHDGLHAEYVIEKVYEPMAAEAQRYGDTIRIFCVMYPAPDMAKKPEQYRETQGVRAVFEFNSKIRRWCYDRGFEPLELFAPSLNASSYDGTHFGLTTNALFGQIFLNTLAQGPGWTRTREIFGDDFLV
jgi:hypothetical protein